MIFEVFYSPTNKLWYFLLKTTTGQVIAESDAFTNLEDIKKLYNAHFTEWKWVSR